MPLSVSSVCGCNCLEPAAPGREARASCVGDLRATPCFDPAAPDKEARTSGVSDTWVARVHRSRLQGGRFFSSSGGL